MMNNMNPQQFDLSEIERELAHREAAHKELKSSVMKNFPFNILDRALQGALEGAGKGGQFIAKQFPGAPNVDVGKTFEPVGGGDQSFLGDLAYGAGKIAPYAAGPAAAGAATKLIPQMLAGGYFGAANTNPGEQNLFGALPSGPVGGAIENAATAGILNKIPGIADYFRTEHAAKEFLAKKAGTSIKELPTAEQNIETLGKRLTHARSTAAGEALEPKQELFAEHGKTELFPSQKRAKQLVNDVSTIFNEGEEVSSSSSKAIEKELKNYYKTGNIDELIESGEDIFHHPGLSKSQISKVEDVLQLEPLRSGSYIKSSSEVKNIPNIKDLHAKFESKTTLENADKLRSALGEQERQLRKKLFGFNANYNHADEEILNKVVNAKEKLTSDMEDFYKKLPPEKQNLYKEFREKWAKDVAKYELPLRGSESQKTNRTRQTIEELAKGKSSGLSREQIANAFKYPTETMESILKDVGPEGVNNIVYNKLLTSSSGDAEKLANAIIESRKSGGYSKIFSQEDEDFAKNLLKRIKTKKYAGKAVKLGALGLGGSELIKHFLP